MQVPRPLDQLGVWFLKQKFVRKSLCKQAFAAPKSSVGDAEEQIDVIPTPRPIIRKTYASIKWPDYLGKSENQIVNLSGGVIQV